MKSHKILCLLLVCALAFSCKKDDIPDSDTPNLGAEADYSLLIKTSSGFDVILMDADVDQLTLSPVASNFPMTSVPDLNFKEGTVFSFLKTNGDCNASFLRFDFKDETAKEIDLFSDLGACSLTAYAIAHHGDTGYVAYGLDTGSGTTGFYVRAFNLNGPSDDFTDVALTKRPVHLSFANSRLFVLTIDEQKNDENYLTAVDASTNSILTELSVGSNAQKLLRNIDDNLIVGHDQFHNLLNSETFSPQYVQYESGLEPLFVSSTVNNFGDGSTMYYERPSGVYSEYPVIPASYNFVSNLTTLYPFEGYLTKNERDFEYKVETTTMVGYDTKNGYMLIGYKKIGEPNKGGILRIRIGDDPAVIDNINVDGIPFNVIAM